MSQNPLSGLKLKGHPVGGRGHLSLAILLLAALVLAGCAASNAPPPTIPSGIGEPKLADFEACVFYDQTGALIRCEDDRVMIEAIAGEPPLPWYCHNKVGGPDFYETRSCTSPLGEWALYLDVSGLSWATDVVARLEKPGAAPVLYGWHLSDRASYTVIPNASNGRLGVTIYGTQMSAEPAALAAARVEHLWTIHGDEDDRAWLLYKLVAGERSYFFDPMRPHPLAPDHYSPTGVWIDGSDFKLNMTEWTIPFSKSILVVKPAPLIRPESFGTGHGTRTLEPRLSP